ncbi:MAG: nuclear transport factor 2 family protein [Hyphomonadaceae bacterium]|nr:nuclear transport factor 2 family protein [Hyphomonadaceae bacterium]
MKTTLLIAAGAALMLAACTPPGAPTAEAPVAAAPAPAALPTQADVDALYAKLDAAMKAKDAAAMAALYVPGAVAIHPTQNAIDKYDPATAAAGLAEWFKTAPAYTINSMETQILDADSVVVSGLVTMDFQRNGRPTWILQRFTDVWQKQADGQWLIAASHVSNAPQPVPARLPPLNPAAAPGPDTPPLGGAAPAPAPAEEKK